MSSPDEVMALYDAHAPRLYALALRITGDERTAAEVLEEVFRSQPLPADLGGLARVTREAALRRYVRSSAATVGKPGMEPVPRNLVEEAFFRGLSVADLARVYQIPEERVRSMLRDGMAELRRQLGSTKEAVKK